MGGATELEIAAQLGHNNVQTTRRYVHLGQEHLRARAGIMGSVIERALLSDAALHQVPLIGRAHAFRRLF